MTKLLKSLWQRRQDVPTKIESEEEALRFIEHLDEMNEEEFTSERREIHRIENSPELFSSLQNSQEINSHSNDDYFIKKPKMPIFEDESDLLKSKERKRNNRVNANRNDYGNEGFLMMILYYLGCCITLSKLQKDGRHQKLRIIEISYEDKILLNRKEIESKVEEIKFPTNLNLKRDKNIIANTTIDNAMLDILKNEFEFQFNEDIKKKPGKSYMPARRVLEHIELEKSYNKKEIVNEGVLFYDNLKEYGKNGKFIYVSKAYVERCWKEGIVVENPTDKNVFLNMQGCVKRESMEEIESILDCTNDLIE